MSSFSCVDAKRRGGSLNAVGKIRKWKDISNEWKNSKVSRLRLFFDRGEPISEAVAKVTKPNPPMTLATFLPSRPLPQFQLTPWMTIPDSLPTCVELKSGIAAEDITPHSNPVCQISLRTKSNAIKDKVKIFERTGENERRIETRKLLFEKPLQGQNDGGSSVSGAKGLTRFKVENTAGAFQGIEDIGKTGHRYTSIRKWGATAACTSTSGGFQAAKLGAIDGPGVDRIQDMVVKKAQCALKEPKPVRIVEIRSLMLLCREKVESKPEKHTMAYSRKL